MILSDTEGFHLKIRELGALSHIRYPRGLNSTGCQDHIPMVNEFFPDIKFQVRIQHSEDDYF